jgi:hypothetical protein
MGRMILLAVFILAASAAADSSAVAQTTAAASDFSAQSRPRARLRVYPGRLLYRECSFKLVPEWRPSGTVIVPRQRCWWVRG